MKDEIGSAKPTAQHEKSYVPKLVKLKPVHLDVKKSDRRWPARRGLCAGVSGVAVCE